MGVGGCAQDCTCTSMYQPGTDLDLAKAAVSLKHCMLFLHSHSFTSHLSPTCYHCMAFHVQDFIRAGMTCIKFFIGFAGRRTTIRDLYSRLHYLTTAQRHFQSALDAKQRARDRPAGGRGRGYHRSSDGYQVLAASIKNMSIPDLHSHISTIALQRKVIVDQLQSIIESGHLTNQDTFLGVLIKVAVLVLDQYTHTYGTYEYVYRSVFISGVLRLKGSHCIIFGPICTVLCCTPYR